MLHLWATSLWLQQHNLSDTYMSFPFDARDGQLEYRFNRVWVFIADIPVWQPIGTLKSAFDDINNNIVSYTNVDDLPLVGNETGSYAFVDDTNRFYVWSGAGGWYSILNNADADAYMTGIESSYTLNLGADPLVITPSITGISGTPTWSYSITDGGLSNSCTIEQSDNTYTITPSKNPDNYKSFNITFSASYSDAILVSTSRINIT